MAAIAEKTVRELALENSSATRVFERLGIDYCCGRALAEFESDLHQHIHLESNILFPRATAMEKAS